MKRFLFFLTLILASNSSAIVTFQKTYGGINVDQGYSVQQTSDNGYIITGFTTSFNTDSSAIYLIKTDSLGDILWTKTFSKTIDDGGECVRQTPDGGYIIVGWTGFGLAKVYLIKTTPLGDTIWTKSYGVIGCGNWGLFVQQTNDNGYIIAGASQPVGSYEIDIYLIKTDSVGDTLWTKVFGKNDSSPTCSYSAQSISGGDSGYIIVGSRENDTYMDVYIIRTNYLGDTLWTKTFGGVDKDCGVSIQQTFDNGFIITGRTKSFGAGDTDVYLIKIDSKGNTLWTKTYGGIYDDMGISVQPISGGINGYIIAGATLSYGTGNYDVYLIRTDSTGNTSWTKTFGGTDEDCGYSVQQTTDNGYIIAGRTCSFGAGGSDVYLIKTDSLGNVAVEESSASVGTKRALSIFPNPFSNSTTIKFNIPNSVGNGRDRSISIYDISGKLIEKTDNPVIGRNLKSGVYFVRVGKSKPVKITKLNELK